MAKETLDALTTLISQVTPVKVKGVRLECKHFFNGAALDVK